ncbi:hypothetical protein IPV09_09115 [Tessaracoccus sp. SD287]|uniref:hypothetical protein n=1 Tax=Tessaracoccus sp. SD287 TaxID=2782008 RepID=UPI001A96E615|nr:hypothetical protein [Tessaracoccus sp. SD287]MBO1031494.1 hypothetical protein [Tessaracoccus sp. SD287]
MSGNSVTTAASTARGWMVAGLVTAALLSGCQPSDDATTPPPSVTAAPTVSTTASPSASPTASATPTPSPSMVVTARPTTPEETAALAAEAEFVYREQQRLIDEYESKGGAATLPEPLKRFVGGVYATAVAESLKRTNDQGHRVEGATLVKRIKVFTDTKEPSSLLGMQFCDDWSETVLIDKDGRRVPVEAWLMNRAEFSRGVDGRLRVTYNEANEVGTCDA